MVETAILPSPDPQVRITFYAADLAPATYRITLYRFVDGIRTTVRSGLGALALGGWTGIDWEAPLGQVGYQAAMVDVEGNDLGTTDMVTVNTPVGSPVDAWLSDPLDAGSAVHVRMLVGAGQDQSRPVQSTRLELGTRTIALVGQRSLLTGLDMPFLTVDDSEREAVQRLISQTGGLVLIRTAAPGRLPRLLYASMADPRPSGFRYTLGGRGLAAWDASVDELSEFEGPPAIAATPWEVYREAFPTWDAKRSAYASWLEAMQRPPQPGGGSPWRIEYAWTGTPNASTSTATDNATGKVWTNLALNPSFEAWSGALPSNTSGANLAASADDTWVDTGSVSMKLSATDQATTDAFASPGWDVGGMRLGMQPGHTYTVMATIHVEAALTAPHSSALQIRFFNQVGGSFPAVTVAAAPNTPGTYPLRGLFTVDPDATQAFIRLYLGSNVVGEAVWWDSFLLVEGEYDGDYFDGDTQNVWW